MHTVLLQNLSRWNLAVATALEGERRADFPALLVAAIDSQVTVESAVINLERRGEAPALLYERGVPSGTRQQLHQRYYARGYLLDPFCLAVEQGLAEGFYSLAEIAPDDFFSSEYYKTYYLGAGSVEDCYFIIDLDADSKVSICIYNGLSCTRFSLRQLRQLRALAPVVLALGRRHWGTQPQAAVDGSGAALNAQLRATFLSFGHDLLTEREQEVCHLLLRGHSAKSSARFLAISSETVRMHRKRLYAKLKIGSQAELFALFIGHLSGG